MNEIGLKRKYTGFFPDEGICFKKVVHTDIRTYAPIFESLSRSVDKKPSNPSTYLVKPFFTCFGDSQIKAEILYLQQHGSIE